MTVKPTSEDIAWAAGVFECEGVFTGGHAGESPKSLQRSRFDTWVLDKLARLFGGKVLGPYGPYASSAPSPSRRPIFRWALNGSAAVAFLQLIEARLSPRQRKEPARLRGRASK